MSDRQFDLKKYLEQRTISVNRALDKFLPRASTKPATIHKAMRYSLFAGGKRMRPAVLLAAAGLLEGQDATTHWAYCDTLEQKFRACGCTAIARSWHPAGGSAW